MGENNWKRYSKEDRKFRNLNKQYQKIRKAIHQKLFEEGVIKMLQKNFIKLNEKQKNQNTYINNNNNIINSLSPWYDLLRGNARLPFLNLFLNLFLKGCYDG